MKDAISMLAVAITLWIATGVAYAAACDSRSPLKEAKRVLFLILGLCALIVTIAFCSWTLVLLRLAS